MVPAVLRVLAVDDDNALGDGWLALALLLLLATAVVVVGHGIGAALAAEVPDDDDGDDDHNSQENVPGLHCGDWECGGDGGLHVLFEPNSMIKRSMM